MHSLKYKTNHLKKYTEMISYNKYIEVIKSI